MKNQNASAEQISEALKYFHEKYRINHTPRDPQRIVDIMEIFMRVWERYPDIRFGQLISNILSTSTAYRNTDIFYIEDDKWLEMIQEFEKRYF